ncbi:MAG: Mth938-like domain-containing protein [Ktedonobacteraceae bacterium]|nr:Mth938-like domain-containing protein [Ktedonobacteraceae bacterium]
MKPKIDQTSFGSITIEGTVFAHDVIIRGDGQVEKRKKKLSKAIYGTSHTLSQDEARYVYEKGTRRLIVGTGQYGNVRLSDEAADYFKRKECQVELLPTPEAIRAWNEAKGQVIGLFHVTC